jgi:GTPase SAR1 family protein
MQNKKSVGKTSFIAKYCNEVNLANATKTDEFKIKSVQVNSKNIQLEIWDT